jgi:hypothetical protein
VELPSRLEYIGSMAFTGLSELNHITFPDSLRAIGDLAFAGTDLEEVTLPARCSIHPSAFHSHVKIHRMPE